MDPDPARAHYQRGLTLVATQRIDDAIAAYRAALAIRSDYLLALVNLAGLYMQRDDAAAAAPLLARAERLAAPDDGVFLINRAKLRRMTGDAAGAIDDAESATALLPEVAAAWTELGMCLLLDPEGSEASAEASEQALALDPHDAWAMHNLAVARDRQGDAAGACEVARAALDAQPDNATFQQTLACALLHHRRAADALPLLRAVLAARPDSFEAHYNLACGLAQTGDGETAVVHVGHALERVPPAIRAGFRAHVPRDPDLAAIHGQASFRALLR